MIELAQDSDVHLLPAGVCVQTPRGEPDQAVARSVARLHGAALMKRMGIEALYRRPNTSKPAPGHKICRSPLFLSQWRTMARLLRKLPITRPNQVWAMDITFVGKTAPHTVFLSSSLPMARGLISLAAVLDWFTEAAFWHGGCRSRWRPILHRSCGRGAGSARPRSSTWSRVAPLVQAAMRRQGSQFTSTGFIKVLAAREIKISMPLGDCMQSPAGNRRQGRLARQRLRRAALADHQRRRGLPARLCQRVRSPGRDRPVSASPVLSNQWRSQAPSTMAAARIQRLTAEHPIRPASPRRCPKWRRRNRGGKPLGKRPEPVQINRTTFLSSTPMRSAHRNCIEPASCWQPALTTDRSMHPGDLRRRRQ